MTRRPDPHAGKRILRMIRPVMAGGGSSEDRLRKIVRLIAGEMGVQVCSCYVMRAGEVLELFATHGLNQAAIHVTRMEPGEGLVGEIASQARPLALSDARAHRAFSYRPETDEDPFLSFCGVPVLRDGRVRGVLVIQTRDHRVWSEDDLETLETLAMIAAELIAALEAITPQEISSAKDVCSGPCRIDAAALNSGLGMGVAVLHDPRPVIRE
ncbi:MAG: GAF domain-containing protein, partial [Pseudomonadota bacterium]|nr:GAF domain-containing protein [Pseudomonadota bacterium]